MMSALERALKLNPPIAATAQTVTSSWTDHVRVRAAWRQLSRVMSGSHVLGWADQAVVSATSFLVLVMIGRWTGPDQLGVYAIGLSVLALLLATQESLVTRPYSIQLHRPQGTPAEHAFNSLALSVLLSMVAALAASATALTLFAFGAHRELTAITWTLAGTIPFVLMREFARRFAFAHLNMSLALMVDIAAAVLTIITLGGLGWAGRLSVVTALIATGASCGLATLGWLYLARAEFAFGLRQLHPALRQSWELGKWFLSGQLALQAQGYMALWLALVFAGATVTGIYTACASIVAFANPVLFGFFNVLTPKFVRTLKVNGVPALRRQAARDAVLLAAFMSSFCIVIFIFGDDVMRLLYRAAEYAGNSHVLAVLAVAALAAAVGTPASLALAAAENARAVAGVTIATAILNVLLVLALLPRFGLLGVSYGILIAEVAGCVGRWTVFLLLAPRITARCEKQRISI